MGASTPPRRGGDRPHGHAVELGCGAGALARLQGLSRRIHRQPEIDLRLFIRACLDSFDPARIILVRSHCPRFWISEDGTIAPTNVDRRDARFLEALDDYFIEQTGCRVSDATLAHFPSAVQWQTFDHRLRRAIEEDLVELCTPHPGDTPDPSAPSRPWARRKVSAGDHVVGAFRENRPVDENRLLEYFTSGGASYDDLLALAYLEQCHPGGDDGLIRTCVRDAVADAGSYPLAVTRRGFDRSLRALRRWRWCSLRLPRGELWTAQITVPCAGVIFRFLGDGSIERVRSRRCRRPRRSSTAVCPSRRSTCRRPRVVGGVLERGRRAITAAPHVVVSDVDELVDTCSWIDWAQVLDNERVVITADPDAVRARAPEAKTDLSFVFDPNTRICTIGGGLMDQVTHVALRTTCAGLTGSTTTSKTSVTSGGGATTASRRHGWRPTWSAGESPAWCRRP